MLKDSQVDLCGRTDFTRTAPLLARDRGPGVLPGKHRAGQPPAGAAAGSAEGGTQ